jgi:acyl-CoA synthetase (AMP-forming)/AMP-acid ligase II
MSAGRNVSDVLAGGDPAAIALIDLRDPAAPVEWRRDALDRAAGAVARALVARGHARGDRVAILAANRAEYLIAFFGIMRAGMVAVPVSFKLPRATIEYILRDAGASLVFCDAERRASCPAGIPAIDLDGTAEPGPFDAVATGPDDVAMILYTSGSTGQPKGVPLTHAGVVWGIDYRLSVVPDAAQHRLLVAAPLFHMNGLFVSAFALAGRASVVLLPQFSTPAYIDAIGRWRCTWLTSVPTMLALVVQEPARLAATDLSSVRRVAMGSAPLTQALIDRVKAAFPGAAISNGYGTTETGPVAFGPHPRGLPRPDLSLGYPVHGLGLRLVDGDNLDAAEGVLQLRTPALMPGYHNRPDKTAEVMTADGYYVTGDVMRRDADGFHYFVGRADDMFVCGGENIYPGEVERMLERHHAIEQACVVPVADEVRGAKPVAFVVPAPGAALTPEQVTAWALANAPAYQHPRHVELVAALPLAGTNKVDRRALEERARRLAGGSRA